MTITAIRPRISFFRFERCRTHFAVISLLMASSINHAQMQDANEAVLADAKRTILSVNTDWVVAMRARDAHRATLAYAQDAIFVTRDGRVLTGHDEIGYARALRHIGVRGYLSKTASGAEIVAAVRAVALGQDTFQGAAAHPESEFEVEDLTDREQEVLALLVQGLRNAEIAERLRTSVKTAEFHVGRLLHQLKARSRTEAILRAQELGLVGTPI